MKNEKTANRFFSLGIIVIIIILTSITGCGPVNPKNINYFKGSDGLVFDFIANYPPYEMYQNTSVIVQAKVHNKGAFNLYDENFYGLLFLNTNKNFIETGEEEETIKQILLKGKSTDFPEGESQTYYMGAIKSKEIGQFESLPTEISLTACYPYRTYFADTVCIDYSEVSGDERMQVCRTHDITAEDQGAPVAVKEVKVNMIPYGTDSSDGKTVYKIKPQFIITIENIGSGNVAKSIYKISDLSLLPPPPNPLSMNEGERAENVKDVAVIEYDVTEICSMISNPPEDYFDYVLVRAKLGNFSLECEPQIVKLKDNEGKIRCSMNEKDMFKGVSNYNSLLIIALDYTYIDTVSSQIKIIRS
ncbi:hypothetical protein JXB41_01600 [Candidatus Woesearchaeota archaeon]|nr:hypothetical protein [Candidatus Woesearchaeota archaeon]